jgi:hypothetical protein
MAKKNLTVAKTFKKIAKLRNRDSELKKEMNVIGSITVRDKSISSLSTNRLVYELAMYRAMYKECTLIVSEGEYRDQIIKSALDVDIKSKLDSMQDHMVMGIERKQIRERIEKLEAYMDNLPQAEKQAYRLEQAAKNIDPRDLTEDTE